MRALVAVVGLLLLASTQDPQRRSAGSDADLMRGIDLVKTGDFESAVVSLEAAIRRMGRDPQRAKDVALAYAYQGVAYLEMKEEGLAKEKFHQALRHDGSFRLAQGEFSPQQIRIFVVVLGELKAAAPSPSPPPKPRGGKGKTVAIVGGGAIVAAGVAVAASGGSDAPPSTTTITPTSTLSASECLQPPSPTWLSPADRATVSGTVNLVCSMPFGFVCPGQTLDFQRCPGNCTGVNTPSPEGEGFGEPLEVGLLRLKPTESTQLKLAQDEGFVGPCPGAFLALHSKIRLLLLVRLVLDVRRDHLVCHVPAAATKVPPSPQVTPPKRPPQVRKLPQQRVRTLPLQPLHQPADRHLRRDRRKQMHVVLRHVPLQDLHVLLTADLPDHLAYPQPNLPAHHRLPILRHPHHVHVDLEHRVRPVSVAHPRMLGL